ncbi:MAG TPA: Gfo/Idh/MocA family oxidoreductase [Planctomycetota bacterium]
MSSDKKQNKGVARREFLAGAGAAALAFTILSNPKSARAFDANGKIQVGLTGCGGRGGWISDLFAKHGGYKLVAFHDYFPNKSQALAKHHQVETAKAYSGLKGYKKILDDKEVDAIIDISPPYFRPEHAADAVEAGKHVYLAKPIGVDVPGCNSILESGKKATAKKLAYLIDFQTRTNEFYKEAIKRVHNGDIGKIFSGEAVYYTGPLGNGNFSQDNIEERLSHWSLDRVLSGDVITEQNIHALDVATWIMDENPVSAVGKCFKKFRGDSVTCNSVYTAVFTFPNDIILTFASKQCGAGCEDIGCKVFCAKGMIETHYGGPTNVQGQGKVIYPGGKSPGIYTEGAISNIAAFHDQIKNSNFENTTVAPSVRSNLTTILGRTACYKGAWVTWDELMKANEKLDVDFKGAKE